MRVSVAMCTFNGAAYLEEQLESLVSQLRLPDQLIVCDDMSTDATLDILDKFAGIVPFEVKIFRNRENLGYVRNFEQAIRLCEGDVIALSDQDDLWYPAKLRELCAAFEQDETIGGIFSDGDLMDSGSQPVAGSLWPRFAFDHAEQRRFRADEALAVLLRRNVVTGMTLAFRSTLRDRVLPISPGWEHDAWIAIMLVLSSRLVMYPEPLVRYRVHRQQTLGVPLQLEKKIQSILTRGPGLFVTEARLRNQDIYSRHARRYEALAEFLAADPQMAQSKSLRQVQSAARFCQSALESLSLPRIERGIRILTRSQQYRQYSVGGLRAMLRDFII